MLLLERGGKKSNLEDTYYFIKPTFAIKDKEGFKYTVAKVETTPEVVIHVYRHGLDGEEEYFHIPWNQYKKNYEAV